MPLGKGGMLSLQEAWDVAAFIDTQKRPEVTGLTGNVREKKSSYNGRLSIVTYEDDLKTGGTRITG